MLYKGPGEIRDDFGPISEIYWLVGCVGLNGPLRQYLSLYRAVSQRVGWLVVLGLTAL